ncbi:Fanconi anemia core complex-associated protein 100 [Ambystoma mexicanum]|uniref:Fanconi anemia core complex-associated protein 100 n=1 Tax=Ambystoma mexicanum TaxID=8296 RepID=UPI0037E74BF6
MSASHRKVTYLAEFQCPSKGLAAGKAQVLCQQSVVYLSNESKFLYVFNKEEKLVKGIYEFPGRIWHIELVSLEGKLYALCAENGIYCVSDALHERSLKETDPNRNDASCSPAIFTVGSEECVLLDSTIVTFTVVNGILVTVSKEASRWRIQKFQRAPLHQEDAKYRAIGEMDISTFSKPEADVTPEGVHFIPFLCCIAPHGAKSPNEELHHSIGFTVESSLFSLLFGVDAAMLHSPMILGGLPDGRLCCVPLKTVTVHSMKSGTREGKGSCPLLQKILYHLEQPVVYIGALSRHARATANGLQEPSRCSSCNCVVVLGYRGKCLTISTGVKEEAPVLVFKEYHIGGSIVGGFCCEDSLYYSTHCNLFTLQQSPELEDCRSVRTMLPANLNICGAAAMALSSTTAGGGVELLALSVRGRLMSCRLSRSADRPQHSPTTSTAKEGPKIKELLSRIGTVSERVSWLKHAIEKKNQSLSHLNQVIHLSCAFLSNQSRSQPISCTVTATWSRVLLQNSLLVSCCLENLTEHTLENGWTLCIRVSASDFISNTDFRGSATTYNFPINKLLPGSKTEMTFPLTSGQNGCLELPVIVSCMLFYSLTGILGNDLISPYSQNSQKRPSVDLLERGGICLPLKEHVVDMLQCLQPYDETEQQVGSSTPQGWNLMLDAVETFLSLSFNTSVNNSELNARNHHQDVPGIGESTYNSPFLASIKLSSYLLKSTLKGNCSGSPLCCAVLQWLLSDNAWIDTVKAQKLSAMHGVAPDGRDVRLLVSEVTMNDLCPEGPIPVVEIKMESSSLAVVSSMHQAVLRRAQNLLIHDVPSSCNPPNVRIKHLQRMITNNEMLLKEAQSLRDHLCLGKDSSSSPAAERLLSIYRELRNPSLVIL